VIFGPPPSHRHFAPVRLDFTERTVVPIAELGGIDAIVSHTIINSSRRSSNESRRTDGKELPFAWFSENIRL
jgi:hypothetical protein